MAFNFRLGGAQGVGGNTRNPTNTPIADIRYRHIHSLKEKCRVEVETPGTNFRVPFQVRGKPLNLKVFLPSNFPQVPPVLYLTGQPLKHPWVEDSKGRIVGCHLLQEWDMASDLGRVVTYAIRQFTDNPPHFLESEQGRGVSRTIHHQQQQHHVSSSSDHKLPPLPDVDSLIADLSINRIKEMSNSEDLLSEFVEELPYIDDCNNTIKSLKTHLIDLASQNISMEPDLTRAKNALKQVQEEIGIRSRSLQEKVMQQQALAEQFNPEAIVHTLAAEVVKAEEQSEHILSEFRDDSQPDVAAFVKNYRAAKLLEHSRRLKSKLYRKSIGM
eukprot:gene686-3986_t